MASDRVEMALAGELDYDALSGPEQEVVRAARGERVQERVAGLDFTDELRRSGQRWAETDADGNLVIHEPDSTQHGR